MSAAEPPGRGGSGYGILRKVLVSVLVGAAAFSITAATDFDDESAVWGVTLSVFIGGVVLVVQFLMAFEARLAQVEETKVRHSAKIEKLVEEGYAKINNATALFGAVESSALPPDTIIQLVQRAALIEPSMPPLVCRLAGAEISLTSEILKGLSEGGTILYEGEDRERLLGLTRQVDSSIDATSLTTVDATGGGFTTDGGFWSSDLGQRYLEAQQAAVRRGVVIRRVFIILHLTEPPSGLDEVCRVQQERGIEVRVLRADAIPSSLRDGMFDFIVFDGVVSYEVTPATHIELATQPTILHTRLELQRAKVETRSQRFRSLWEAAQVFE